MAQGLPKLDFRAGWHQPYALRLAEDVLLHQKFRGACISGHRSPRGSCAVIVRQRFKLKLAIRRSSGFRLHRSLAPRLNIHCNERRASNRDQPLLIVGNADIDDANRPPDFDGRRDSNKLGT